MMKASRANAARSRPLLLLVTLALLWLGAPLPGLAQPAGCDLVPDDRHPDEEILRCGDRLTIHAAANTKYRIEGQVGQEPPTAARIESGALLIEFTPSDRRKNFQILTPHAIAAVRGTKWAVDVLPDRTATLVIGGAVEVSHVARARTRRIASPRRGRGRDRKARPDRGQALEPGAH